MKKLINFILKIFGLGTKSAPKLGNSTLMMYGRVNRWALNKKLLKQEINDIKKAKIDGYLIEMAGWAGHEQWTENWVQHIEKMYAYLLKLCRKNGIWLFVSIVNDNMGLGKYGDTSPKLEKVYGIAQRLAQIVKKNKKDNVIVQPTAETQTSAGAKFDVYCNELLNDFVKVYNGSGGRPNNIPNGFHYRAWHPANTSQQTDPPNNLSKTFIISDHGLLIQELGKGLDGPGRPEKVENWARRLKNRNFPVVGYYGFLYEKRDKDTVMALGRAKKS